MLHTLKIRVCQTFGFADKEYKTDVAAVTEGTSSAAGDSFHDYLNKGG